MSEPPLHKNISCVPTGIIYSEGLVFSFLGHSMPRVLSLSVHVSSAELRALCTLVLCLAHPGAPSIQHVVEVSLRGVNK